MAKNRQRVGVWIVGACGSVGCTVALGLAALRKGLTSTVGLVTELPVFQSAELVDPRSFVLGGHDIRTESLPDAVRGLHQRAGLFDAETIKACTPWLKQQQGNIKRGTLIGTTPIVRRLADASGLKPDRTAAGAIERLSDDITRFRRRYRLEHVVVVYLASSEPRLRKVAAHQSYSTLGKALSRRGESVLPPSSLYALAAIESQSAFVNFTPGAGMSPPAVAARAHDLGIAYGGDDGKTGESLVKCALAPMFAMRNLRVRSWVGQNILGNRDGAVLSDARTRAAKIRSKDGLMAPMIGREATTRVGIDYVPSLDDWKVAWDYIHFEGFLGTKMSLQFTWQGSDSALAAPLVIDLVRLAVHECRAERAGPMKHLAFFFKRPLGVRKHDLATQWQMLVKHVTDST